MLTAEYDYATDIAVQREEAMQQGENKRNADIVQNMLTEGLEVQTISKYTKLDISEIERIRDKIQ